MSRLAPITSFSIMLRINQWIIKDSSDLLSDIHSRQRVVATGSFIMCLDINVPLMPNLSSAIWHRAPLTVMFYYLTSATYSYRVARCYGAMGLRCHHISPLRRSNGNTVFIVTLWYTANLQSASTYYSKTTEPYASYARITHLLLYAYRQG